MHNDEFDFDLDDETYRQMDLVLNVAARQILNNINADEFLEWAQSALPTLAPSMFAAQAQQDITKTAYWLGRNLWNAAPLPDNHFKPRPLPKPSRNEPCPCGSGLKYKQCCIHEENLPPLHTEVFWPALAQVMSKSHINQLIKEQQLPIDAISAMSLYFAENEDHLQVIKVLDPLFAGSAARLNHNQSGLLDLLVDSYNLHYRSDKKKKDLLSRMKQHNDRVIRAEAWQRIASWQQDQGNFTEALEALTEAMRADPDNPSHSLLELTLLLSSNRIEQAKQRAAFWLRKLKHYEQEFPQLIETLSQAQTDPQSALQLSMNKIEDDDRLPRLIEWINNNNGLQLPQYTVTGLNNKQDLDQGMDQDIDIKSAISERLADLGIADDEINKHLGDMMQSIEQLTDKTNSRPEMPDFDEMDDDDYDDPMQNAVYLLPPGDIQALEDQWFNFDNMISPFSIQPELEDNQNIWLDSSKDSWLCFLEQNPQAMNSLGILDDICNLISMHPHNDTVWGPASQMQPLLERAEKIIKQAQIPKGKELPWVMFENRPILRLLSQQINMLMNNNEEQSAIEKIQHYLTLNPQDNHSYRALLVNLYLQHNMNQQALNLAEQYPDDLLAETRYGMVLARYRLGDLNAAQDELALLLEELPLVAEYLVKARVARPRLSEQSVSIGGKDQAWVYREEMRGSWVETEGCIKWLKKQLAKYK